MNIMRVHYVKFYIMCIRIRINVLYMRNVYMVHFIISLKKESLILIKYSIPTVLFENGI